MSAWLLSRDIYRPIECNYQSEYCDCCISTDYFINPKICQCTLTFINLLRLAYFLFSIFVFFLPLINEFSETTHLSLLYFFTYHRINVCLYLFVFDYMHCRDNDILINYWCMVHVTCLCHIVCTSISLFKLCGT